MIELGFPALVSAVCGGLAAPGVALQYEVLGWFGVAGLSLDSTTALSD